MSKPPVNQLVDHLFRREAGKMVAVLSKLFGFQNLHLAEDIVQDTMLTALSAWSMGTVPENPSAWLYKVARNKAVDSLRRKQNFQQFSATLQEDSTTKTDEVSIEDMFLDEAIKDDQLRMIFACCHPALNPSAQISLILKTLCGLSVQEIASAFLTTEGVIEKRLYRTREKIRNENILLDLPNGVPLEERIRAVLQTIYLLFNEGYYSSHPDRLIRKDLCEEAMLLCQLLYQTPLIKEPSVGALLSLMCFQSSRFEARLDRLGEIVLLAEQDRTLWDKRLIDLGVWYLEQSAYGNLLSKYHLEAAIAYYHSTAKSFAVTEWGKIINCYDQLLVLEPNPIVELNRCVALAQIKGYTIALEQALGIEGLEKNHLYYGILGEFYWQVGNKEEALRSYEIALSLTLSKAERELLKKKLQEMF